MIWTVYCLDKPGTTQGRDRLRTIHRQYLDTFMDKLFFSGPIWSDDGAEQIGSMFLMRFADRREAEDYIANEPFNQEGLFQEIRIFRMSKGRFNAHLVD